MKDKLEIIGSKLSDIDLDKARLEIADSESPTGFDDALTKFVLASNKVADVKKEFKSIVKELEEKYIKPYDDMVKNTKELIKSKVSQTYEQTTNTKVVASTGEVKEVIKNNLGNNRFSYVPAKTNKSVDFAYMTSHPDEFKDFVKEVKSYVIDKEAVNDYLASEGVFGFGNLPVKEIKKPESFSIQSKVFLATMLANKEKLDK